jgi:protein subunit release factor B
MKFPDDAPVTEKKREALKEKIATLHIEIDKIDVKYIRASGPGGQKVNKTSSGVHLHYAPLSIQVKWTRERSRALNRFLALRELVDKIEQQLHPQANKKTTQHHKMKKQKDRNRRRRAAKETKSSVDDSRGNG